MKYGGKVQGGVVVLDAPSALKEGTAVTVEAVAGKAQRKRTKEEVLAALDKSALRFTKSWDEIKLETR